jgi:hypothetical protein
MRLRRAAAALAGPGLIVVAVLVVLWPMAFGGMVTNQHPDVLAEWLPTHCFLGSSLSAGHVPAWNPFAMGGVPFAADPQSGWMYLPAMALYTLMPCGAALRWFVVAQPLIAGLGMYGFLRSERVSRAAATAGGVVLALLIAGSYLAVSLPFSGALAWSAVLLWCASRLVRSGSWPARIGWLVAAAVAWGQVASAHLSNGLVIGTGALAAYLAGALVAEVRSRRMPAGRAAAVCGLLVAALPAVNLAVLVPRIAWLSHSSLAMGYQGLAERAAAYRGVPSGFGIGPTADAGSILALAGPVGAYAGMSALAVALGGWRRRGGRAVWATLAAFGLVCYLLSLRAVAGALEHVFGFGSVVGNYYLHEPARFRMGVLLVLPALVGFGVEAWRRSGSRRDRLLLVAPGVLVWWVVAPAAGLVDHAVVLAVLGAVVGGAALVAAVRRPVLVALVPAVLAVELVANGLIGQTPRYTLHGDLEIPAETVGVPPLRQLDVRVDDYLRPDRFVRVLRSLGPIRYLSIPPATPDPKRGALSLQRPQDWPLEANQRAMLFGLEDVDGMNPVQSARFWWFLRATDQRAIRYNAAFYRGPPGVALDLLDVGAVVVPAAEGCGPADPGAEAAATEGGFVLCNVRSPPPRAQLVDGWRVVGSRAAALRAVTAGGFDPEWTVVLESDPGLPASVPRAAVGSARFVWTGRQSARVDVRAARAGLLLVRNTYDPHWHATVDGKPAPVLPADSFLQAVPVPAGSHEVLLAYDDPSIGVGLLGSVAALAILAGAAVAIAVVGRRRRRDVVGA